MKAGSLLWLILVIGVIGWIVKGNSDVWRGFYYPGGVLSGPVIYSPEYKNKEDCISWSENEWRLHPSDANLNPQDLYECGKNCKINNPSNPAQSIYVCEQNFDGGDWRRGDYGN